MHPDDAFFEKLASQTDARQPAPPVLKSKILSALSARQDDPLLSAVAIEPEIQRAPSRLKSRIYSALVRKQLETGPLLSLAQTRPACVFEQLVRISPAGEKAKQFNYCRVCHARVLAERVEGAWIYWPGCPYVRFQNR